MKPESSKKKNFKLGIAFGGGAARGFAHIGVLEALASAEDDRLMPQFIAGTSTGSIMGALYASGLSVEDIKSATENMAWAREVVDVSRSIRDSLVHLTGALLPWGLENWLKNDMGIEFDHARGGFLSSRGLESWIDRLISPQRSFEDLRKKLAVVATEIVKKERVILTSPDIAQSMDEYFTASSQRRLRSRIVDNCSSLATAIRASCAIPVVFEAIREQGLYLADGGIVDQVPVEVARAMGADIVIGVSLGFTQYFENPQHPHQMLSNLLDLMSREGIAQSLAMADIAVDIEGIETTSLMDMEQREALITQGRAAMEARLEDLTQRVDHHWAGDGQI